MNIYIPPTLHLRFHKSHTTISNFSCGPIGPIEAWPKLGCSAVENSSYGEPGTSCLRVYVQAKLRLSMGLWIDANRPDPPRPFPGRHPDPGRWAVFRTLTVLAPVCAGFETSANPLRSDSERSGR